MATIRTQTDIARQHMTPQTKALLPPRLLDARIGNGTVAGGLNRQIRFRVDGVGEQRHFVPDSKLAVDIMATPAGPKLVKQLEVAARSADWRADKSNLTGFVLPEDTQSAAAAQLLGYLEPGGPPLASPADTAPRAKQVRQYMKDTYESTADSLRSAGAWNQRGWITYAPDTARAMLTSVGAYEPARNTRSEKRLRRAGSWSEFIGGVSTHEVQHSITSRKGRYPNARWMEEGIANIFSETPVFLNRQQQAMGVNARSYAGHLAQDPVIDLEWGPWKRQQLPKAERDAVRKEQKKRYQDSQPILRGLLRMADAPLNTGEGVAKARQLLQGDELDRVPGNLAKAIIEHYDLDPKAYEPLRKRVLTSIESPTSLREIARDFDFEFKG